MANNEKNISFFVDCFVLQKLWFRYLFLHKVSERCFILFSISFCTFWMFLSSQTNLKPCQAKLKWIKKWIGQLLVLAPYSPCVLRREIIFQTMMYYGLGDCGLLSEVDRFSFFYLFFLLFGLVCRIIQRGRCQIVVPYSHVCIVD